jgi:hypothetical protein
MQGMAVSVKRVLADRDLHVGVRFGSGGVADRDFFVVIRTVAAGIRRGCDTY